MYFIISFDIITKDTIRAQSIREFIKNEVSGLYWVKPLTDFFVVKCNDERRRRNVLENLIEHSKGQDNSYRFIITPLIDSGNIAGLTASELWPHIDEITSSKNDRYGSGHLK